MDNAYFYAVESVHKWYKFINWSKMNIKWIFIYHIEIFWYY